LQAIAAATLDLDLAEQALEAGANHAGDLTERILSNQVHYPKQFQLLICTPELAHEMTGKTKLARKLKKHKITPSKETKTIVEPEEFCDAVRKYAYGFYTPYKSDLHGNISTRLARFAEPDENIIENFHYVLRHIFDTQLTQFGNGPDAKKKNIGKYILGIHIVASQGDSYNLNLDTIEICRELNQQTIPITPGKRWKMKKIKN
jgi:ribosomal protein L1